MFISQKRAQAESFLLNELKAAATRYNTPREKHYYACLTLLATALVAGTDIPTLAERTGFRKHFVSRVSARMHRASLWKGDQIELDEWADWEFMQTLFVHACVASGMTGRETDCDGTVAYFDFI